MALKKRKECKKKINSRNYNWSFSISLSIFFPDSRLSDQAIQLIQASHHISFADDLIKLGLGALLQFRVQLPPDRLQTGRNMPGGSRETRSKVLV
jgi:hypothetical protein